MRLAVQRLAMCVLCLGGLAGWSASASEAASLPSPLVVPGVQQLDGNQQQQDAAESQLTSPSTVAAREASRSEYERQETAQAAATLAASFPALISEHNGGPPPLPAGQTITGFEDANLAQVSLGAGRGALIESLIPMATETAPHSWSPVDLSLRENGSAFEAARPLVPIRLPKHLNEGAELSSVGVSVTPVDAQGVPLQGAEGDANDASVLFANTQTDSDTILKPTTLGIDESTTVRAVDSPEEFYYRITLPQGASLTKSADSIEVVMEGATIVTIPTPTATDAEGTTVPTSVALNGDTLAVRVAHRSGSYRYPIVLDPEFYVLWEDATPPVWYIHEWVGYHTGNPKGELFMHHEGSFAENDYAEWSTYTEGYTKFFQAFVRDNLYPASSEDTEPWMRTWISITGPGSEAHYLELAGHPYLKEGKLCSNSACSPEGVENANGVHFGITTQAAGSGPNFGANATELSTELGEEKGLHTTVAYNTGETEVSYLNEHGEKEHALNVLYSGGRWLGPHSGAFEFTANDGGVGVAETKVEEYGSGWESFGGKSYQTENSACAANQCLKEEHEAFSYNTLIGSGGKHLPDGEDKLRVAARSPMPYTTSSEYGEGETTIRVDSTPPHGLALTGLAGTGEPFEIGENEEHVKAEATDGTTARSSGIQSIGLYVDEHEIGKAGGDCTPGPCTASNEWEINGAELGAGLHTLTIKATDNAGNVETKTYKLTVHSAAPIALQPGSVNPQSGDFALEATDVNLSGSMGNLTVSRHYDSRNPTEGKQSPFGPQWTISLGTLATLEVLPDKSLMVIGREGLTHFTESEGKFEAPPGDTNLKIEYRAEYEGKEPAYLLKDEPQGTTTIFRLPKGSEVWVPSVSKSPIATDSITDEYGTVEVSGKTIVEPTLELAPHPAATCVREHLERGCRGLEFVYAKTTTATGENRTEWGDEAKSLKEVVAVAYNPATKAMAKTPVAAYEYDNSGRLRAEWNPGISPPLKTVYGYDEEGHVTALTPPGQESWAFTYGTITGDRTAGRLLKSTRAPASAPLWKGTLPVNTVAPVLSGTPALGTRMTVSTGTWSNEPVTYSYQWEDCNATGKECAPILGATNSAYTLSTADLGHTLLASVTATNGGGSVIAPSAASAEAALSTVYSLPKGSAPQGVVAGPDGNMWYTNYNEIGKVTATGGITEYALPANSHASGIAKGPDGNLWYTNWSASKIGKITTTGTITEYALPANSEPAGITVGPEKNLWYADAGTDKIGKITTSGTITEYALPQGASPYSITEGPDENLWYTDAAHGKIGKITPSGIVTEYAVNAELSSGLATGPDKNLWFGVGSPLAGHGEIGKITTSGAVTEYATGSEVGVTNITQGPDGNMWFTSLTPKGAVIGRVTTTGSITEYKAPNTDDPYGIASGSNGTLWYTDLLGSRIGVITVAPTEGEQESPEPGTTMEYHVPLTGATGLPAMTSTEVAKWGQKDLPVNAMSIFPPYKSKGWPATEYAGATTYYMDSQARTVNIANAAGGISTTEYTPTNQINRALTAENRATALKEANTIEASEHLDTKSAYNTEGELTDSWGPQHTVKLQSGKTKPDEEVLARNHVKYFYDEGAPTGGEDYELVTKTVDGAETASKEEFDKRATINAYSGQSNLGWKLRKPTSVTTEPGGLNLTSTTKYVEATGNVEETTTPAAAGNDADLSPAYQAQFGHPGSEGGLLVGPRDTVISSTGNVYVLDSGNNRIDEFSSAGTFVQTFGWGVANGKAEFEICKTSCKAGIAGSGNGQISNPFAMAEDTKGDLWVADNANNRVEEFNSKDEYKTQFGKEGTGNGQFKEPKGIAVTASGTIFVTDAGNQRIEKFNEKGEFVSAFGYGVSSGEAKFQICTTGCRAGIAGSGPGQFKEPRSLAVSSSGTVWVTDPGNSNIEGFKENGEYVTTIGKNGTGNGQFTEPKGIAIDPAGDLWVSDAVANRVQEFSSQGVYMTTMGVGGTGNGQFEEPWGLSITSASNMYIADIKDDRIERWAPTVTGATGAHATKTIYYSAKAEAEVAACREHPEWVGLPCQTKPVAQPGDEPELPVTTVSYNIWNQPETTEEAFGAVVRKKKATFDGGDRPIASEETSTVGTTLPKTAEKYDIENGTRLEVSTLVNAAEKTIKSYYNTLGELWHYTDARGNTANYEYDRYGRLISLKDQSNEQKGEQTYSYNETTGQMETLHDSGAGTFAATYTVGGKMASESYPNGMTAYETYNATGSPTKLEYKKLTHCTEEKEQCVWFKDSLVPSIHGEAITLASTLAEDPTESYDAAGRLTEVQEIPAGEGCKTRLYSYDEDGNRVTETQREPTSEGKCATEKGATEWHTYDTADRPTDPGTTYDAFGDAEKIPAADAGGSELTSSFYVDGQVAKQKQNGETVTYVLDPEDRPEETISEGTTASEVFSHYDGPGNAVAWTSEHSLGAEKFTRNIPGIGGELAAVQSNGVPAVLELHDLHGNIVATAAISETETKLLSKYNSSEFGVPTTKAAPPKYAWLGAGALASESNPSGTITQDGVTYVPQLGRDLQTHGVEIPSPANVNPSFTDPEPAWATNEIGQGSAHQITAYNEARAAEAAADPPAGAVPSPEGEGGGRAPISMSTQMTGGCSGGGACAASYTDCSSASLFGEEHGLLILAARVRCNRAVSVIQLKACIFAWNGSGNKNANSSYIECVGNGNKQNGKEVHNASEDTYLDEDACGLGWSYKAWVWGFAGGTNYWFSDPGENSHQYVCEGDGSLDAEEFADFVAE